MKTHHLIMQERLRFVIFFFTVQLPPISIPAKLPNISWNKALVKIWELSMKEEPTWICQIMSHWSNFFLWHCNGLNGWGRGRSTLYFDSARFFTFDFYDTCVSKMEAYGPRGNHCMTSEKMLAKHTWLFRGSSVKWIYLPVGFCLSWNKT